MLTTVKFDSTTDIRGRNGWFRLDRAECFAHTDDKHEHAFQAEVFLYSAKAGGSAPSSMQFRSVTELRLMAETLTHMANAFEA
jgi:hypothetical protein